MVKTAPSFVSEHPWGRTMGIRNSNSTRVLSWKSRWKASPGSDRTEEERNTPENSRYFSFLASDISLALQAEPWRAIPLTSFRSHSQGHAPDAAHPGLPSSLQRICWPRQTAACFIPFQNYLTSKTPLSAEMLLHREGRWPLTPLQGRYGVRTFQSRSWGQDWSFSFSQLLGGTQTLPKKCQEWIFFFNFLCNLGRDWGKQSISDLYIKAQTSVLLMIF